MRHPDTAWLTSVAASLQVAAGRILGVETEDVRLTLAALAQQLPAPANHAETLILRSLTLDLASKCGAFLHAQAHRSEPRPACGFSPAAILDQCWARIEEDPRALLSSWVETFFPAFIGHHPPGIAEATARLLWRTYDRPWTVRGLARSVVAPVSALPREFEREFGLSILAYQRTLRIIAALEQLRTEKTEAVALQVGFRSRKNFYRALHQVTRLTPTRFRALPEPHADALIASLRLALIRGRVTGVADLRGTRS